jgi:hypothetical protein
MLFCVFMVTYWLLNYQLMKPIKTTYMKQIIKADSS